MEVKDQDGLGSTEDSYAWSEERKENQEAKPNPFSHSENHDKSGYIKNFKTTLCQFYLQGPCKNGNTCNYAHGTSELRTATGFALKDALTAKEAMDRAKTKLCEKFLQFGSCQFGPKCNFAHGVKELQKAVSTLNTVSTNPAYKTSLCQNYLNSFYCQFGDGCQFAHGNEELRSSSERRTTSQNSSGMATRANFASSYPTRPPHPAATASTGPPMPGNFKTVMCKNFVASKPCNFGAKCQFAHGQHELRPLRAPPRPPPPPTFAPAATKYKTVMCREVEAGKTCSRGVHCNFAHSPLEIRSSPTPTPSMMRPHRPPPSFMPPVQQRPPVPNSNHRYKTVMCANINQPNGCSRANSCNFAHTQSELVQARTADPRYKTVLCENFKRDQTCHKGMECSFAHGQSELRFKSPPESTLSSYSYVENYGPSSSSGYSGYDYSSYYNYPNHSSFTPVKGPAPGLASDPRYKTVLCSSFMSKGFCDKSNKCTFAHGVADLANSENYKTTMCKHITEKGSCPKANLCFFAHTQDELRSPGVIESSGHCGNLKRKQPDAPTDNGASNDGCPLTHGEEDSELNKRPRI